jgi:DNA-binding MarR family transcriptional regulator
MRFMPERARSAHHHAAKAGTRPRRREPASARRESSRSPGHRPSTYHLLAAFRYEVRRFLAFSERAARSVGLEPQQHQLLLAIRGLPRALRPTIGTIAERLCVAHHTAVALVDKLERRGLVRRERSSRDRREVLLRLTPRGRATLRKLSSLHREQLAVAGPAMVTALRAILKVRSSR